MSGPPPQGKRAATGEGDADFRFKDAFDSLPKALMLCVFACLPISSFKALMETCRTLCQICGPIINTFKPLCTLDPYAPTKLFDHTSGSVAGVAFWAGVRDANAAVCALLEKNVFLKSLGISKMTVIGKGVGEALALSGSLVMLDLYQEANVTTEAARAILVSTSTKRTMRGLRMGGTFEDDISDALDKCSEKLDELWLCSPCAGPRTIRSLARFSGLVTLSIAVPHSIATNRVNLGTSVETLVLAASRSQSLKDFEVRLGRGARCAPLPLEALTTLFEHKKERVVVSGVPIGLPPGEEKREEALAKHMAVLSTTSVKEVDMTDSPLEDTSPEDSSSYASKSLTALSKSARSVKSCPMIEEAFVEAMKDVLEATWRPVRHVQLNAELVKHNRETLMATKRASNSQCGVTLDPRSSSLVYPCVF